jgi:aspartate racemase
MRCIGLIGGMSWESSALYYRLLNEGVKQRLGGLHSARCVLASVDFAEVEAMQSQGRWVDAGELLAAQARGLEAAGADVVLICTNTMHKVADQVAAAIGVPLLHLADVVADAVTATGIDTVALLGTRFTMEESFYSDRLTARGLSVLTPDADDRALVDRVIYTELVLGTVEDASRAAFVEIIERLAARGAQGVILGCTEIELLVGPSDIELPTFATTRLHAEAAVEFALS